MFHGCAMRVVPIMFFCAVFVILALILLCYAIVVAIQNKNNRLGFKRIIKVAFSDSLGAGLDIGLFILAVLFILMVITTPISYSKKHALKEAQFYYERCVTLSEEINRANENNEIPEELKPYDVTPVNEKIEEYEEAKRELDYWYERTNK